MRIIKVFTAIVLSIIGLIGLLISTCGGIFTLINIAIFFDRSHNYRIDDSITMLILSLLSLTIGGSIAWGIKRLVVKLVTNKPKDNE